MSRAKRIGSPPHTPRKIHVVANHAGHACVLLYPGDVKIDSPLIYNVDQARQLRDDITEALAVLEGKS